MTYNLKGDKQMRTDFHNIHSMQWDTLLCTSTTHHV